MVVNRTDYCTYIHVFPYIYTYIHVFKLIQPYGGLSLPLIAYKRILFTVQLTTRNPVTHKTEKMKQHKQTCLFISCHCYYNTCTYIHTYIHIIAKRAALHNNITVSQSVCNLHEQLSVCLWKNNARLILDRQSLEGSGSDCTYIHT